MTQETIGSDDCAKLLRCTVEQAEELARAGEIPATKFGREWLYVRADLIAYIAERARHEARERQARRAPGGPTPIKRSAPRQRHRAAPALPFVGSAPAVQ